MFAKRLFITEARPARDCSRVCAASWLGRLIQLFREFRALAPASSYILAQDPESKQPSFLRRLFAAESGVDASLSTGQAQAIYHDSPKTASNCLFRGMMNPKAATSPFTATESLFPLFPLCLRNLVRFSLQAARSLVRPVIELAANSADLLFLAIRSINLKYVNAHLLEDIDHIDMHPVAGEQVIVALPKIHNPPTERIAAGRNA